METKSGSGPLFSVVIPTCHRNDLLAKCLECLAPGQQEQVKMLSKEMQPQQELTEELAHEVYYEVIVSDDGRRFTAQDMIRDRFPWAHWVAGPKMGPAANRNAGAAVAKGDWLVFTDDDCLPLKGWLADYLAGVRTEEADVYEGLTFTDSEKKGVQWMAPVNTVGGYLWSCNFAIKRSVFQKIGGFDSAFPYPHLEDVDLRERLKAEGYPFPFRKNAAVFHPLRRVGSMISQAKSHESYFYYAKKHGISLGDAGLSPMGFVRIRARLIRECSDFPDFLRLAWRSLVESVLVSLMSMRWLSKYRR